MKTIIAAILAIVLVLSLSACEGGEIPEEKTSKLDSSFSENSKPESSKPEESSEPDEESAFMTFKLGLGGETAELSAGDTLGEWVLESLEVDTDESTEPASVDYIHADFSGTVTLEGYIERNQMLEHGYDFTVSEADRAKLPYIVLEDSPERYWFLLDIPEDLENYPDLDFNESLYCKITVSGCSRGFSYTEGMDGLDVVKIEPDTSVLYEEMLINFGGRNRDGVLGVAKGVSLYYDSNGCDDYSKIDDGSAYSFVMFHSDSSNYIQISVPGVLKDAYAFPEEYFEALVLRYFDTTAEHLRSSDYYYPEQHCYCIGTGGGIGETPALVINSIDENGDTVVFHLTIDYSTQDDYNMALTVRLDSDGGYKYLSYLPE
ncbi:MAG: hypothetical protein IJ306_07935 [Oscillospiraceae bacterium]|nr:hypothetical protein [Oscillospiraceae bacterium]